MPHLATRSEQIPVDYNSGKDVNAVQARYRKINGKKGIGGGKEAVVKFSGIFKVFNNEENKRKRNCESHVQFVFCKVVQL